MLLNQYEKPSLAHYKILLFSWAGWIFDFYDLMLFSFLLGPIGEEMKLSKTSLSYVLGGALAATALGGLLFGVLSDRFGRKKALQWTILTYSLGTLLCGFAWDFWSLMFFRLVTGLGVGGEWATGQTFVGESFPPRVRGRYGAFMQTGAPLGIALASLVGGFLAPSYGWRFCFILSVLPALLVVFIRKGMPESDLWEKSRGAGKPTGMERQGRVLSLLSAEHRGAFLLCFVLALFEMSAYWFTYIWLPGYLNQERHFSMAKSAEWILVVQTGGFLGYFLFGFFADHFGRRPAFSVYALFWASGLWMVTWFWELVAGTPVIVLTFMFLVGFGTGMFGGIGPLFSELFPTGIRNTAMGTAFNLARGIQFFTPVLITWIGQFYGLGAGISLAAIFALLAGAWIWLFPETKGRTLE
ncbi:MAG TPA: MFS transporter [bacterium]|nr:MFS transporter [bacterium]